MSIVVGRKQYKGKDEGENMAILMDDEDDEEE